MSHSYCYSYAMVARDHEEQLIEAVSRCKQGTIDPELAGNRNQGSTQLGEEYGLAKCGPGNGLSCGNTGDS